MSEPLTSSEIDALEYLYGGGDEQIESSSMRWVVTRHKQKCMSVMHKGPMTIPARTRMVLEQAKVEGQFGSCYTCKDCVERSKHELEGR